MNANPKKLYLIAGLGNPGSKYEDTRHNTGFRVIDLWGRDMEVHLERRGFQSRFAHAEFRQRGIILLRPLTFMNRSGESVRACADHYGLENNRILAIHDDIDLPVGRIKIVRDGGAGGHRGVLSLIEHLGSTQFPRIKIGIGRPQYGETIEDYVLSSFYSGEEKIMERTIRMAVKACELFVSVGVESAMSQINCQNLSNKEVRS